jgi:hypothetical protein
MALINNGFNNRSVGRFPGGVAIGADLRRPIALDRLNGIPSTTTGAQYLLPPSLAYATPFSIPWSTYYRAGYSAAPWVRTASNGASDKRGDLISSGVDPTAGTAIKGFAPASFVGASSQNLQYTALHDQIFREGLTIVTLFLATTLPAAGANNYDYGVFFSDFLNAEISFGLNSTGITACVYSVRDAAYENADVACSAGEWILAACKIDAAGNLSVRRNRGAWVPTSVGPWVPLTPAGNNCRMGLGYASTRAFNGQILEQGTVDYDLSDAELDAYGRYIENRYGFALGFGSLALAVCPDQVWTPPNRARLHQSFATRVQVAAAAALTPTPPPQYPSTLARLAVVQPESVTRSLAPVAAAVTLPDVDYPAALARAPSATAQLAAALPPLPDTRLVQHVGATVPAAIDRVALPVGQQQAFVRPADQPVAVPLIPDVEGPAFVTRPSAAAALAAVTFAVSPKPDRAVVLAEALAPAATDRRAVHASAQLAVTSLSPQPDARTVQHVGVVAPDAIARPSMHASQQLATTSLSPSPLPSTTLVPVLFATFPDAVAGLAVHASRQQATALQALPDTRRVPYVGALAPDAIDRAVFRTSSQLAPAPLPPFPDARSVPFTDALGPVQARPAATVAYLLPPYAQPVLPPGAVVVPTFFGAVVPPWLAVVPRQHAGYVAPPTNERLSAPLLPTVVALPPLAVPRVTPTGASSPVAPPAAVPVVPTFFEVEVPAWLATQRAQPTGAVHPPLVPSTFAPTFPDVDVPAWLPRPYATPQVAGLTVGILVRERQAPLASVSWPDRVPGIVPAVQPQSFIGGSPRPLPTPPPIVLYPDAIARRTLAAAHHPAFATSPKPEHRLPLDARAYFPDAVDRVVVHASVQPFWGYGTFITPATTARQPSCLTTALALSTKLTSSIVIATVVDGVVTVSTRLSTDIQGCDE